MFGKKILILIPHPDDEVVGCLAGILRANLSGSHIFGFYLTTGIYPLEKEWPWKRHKYQKKIERRFSEAKNVARLLNIEPLFVQDISSRLLKENFLETRRRLLEVLEQKTINVIWTPAYEGSHPDHDVTNFLASTLKSFTNVWEFSEYHFHEGKHQSSVFIQPHGGEKTLLLSQAEKELKRKALEMYPSEKFNLRFVKPNLSREVYRPLADYDYTHPPHLGKTFYQRFQWFSFHPRVNTTNPQELCLIFKRYMT